MISSFISLHEIKFKNTLILFLHYIQLLLRRILIEIATVQEPGWRIIAQLRVHQLLWFRAEISMLEYKTTMKPPHKGTHIPKVFQNHGDGVSLVELRVVPPLKLVSPSWPPIICQKMTNGGTSACRCAFAPCQPSGSSCRSAEGRTLQPRLARKTAPTPASPRQGGRWSSRQQEESDRMFMDQSNMIFGFYILLKLLLTGSSTASPSPLPVHAIDFSSLIIFFMLIFSSEPSWRRWLRLYKIDTIAFILCMRSPLAVVSDLFFSSWYGDLTKWSYVFEQFWNLIRTEYFSTYF